MAGDPSNARLWADADVYVSFNLDATVPADASTPFGVEWDLVGLLDGDEGFTTTRNEDTTDRFAWGGVLVRTGRRNFKLTRSFTALEWNATTRSLAWPGSGPGEIRVPKPHLHPVLVGWETRDGLWTRRLISAHRCEVSVDGDMTENEPDVSTVTFAVTVFPDATGLLFHEQTDEPDEGS